MIGISREMSCSVAQIDENEIVAQEEHRLNIAKGTNAICSRDLSLDRKGLEVKRQYIM